MRTILMSLLAGVVGMGLGGLFTALVGSKTERMTSIFLSFASGVMISIVFLELIPVSIELANLAIAISGIIVGAVLVLILNNLMDKFTSSKKGSKFHETFAEFFHSNEIIANKSNMLRSGIIMLFAIGLHNIPEGLALGAAGYHDAKLGLALVIIIGLHNIPEGMAVSAPLIAGGLSKVKAALITLAVGSTTVIGAVIGVLLGGVSDIAVAISFSIAGGSMLYVVFAEILPQSIVSVKDRVPTFFTLAGIIVGMLFMNGFAVL